MNRIEITSIEVITIEGKSKTTGNPYKIRKQLAYLHTGKHYPEAFEISLGRAADGSERPAYPVGYYTLAPGSIGINSQTKGLEIKPFETVLVREVDAPKAVAPVAAAR